MTAEDYNLEETAVGQHHWKWQLRGTKVRGAKLRGGEPISEEACDTCEGEEDTGETSSGEPSSHSTCAGEVDDAGETSSGEDQGSQKQIHIKLKGTCNVCVFRQNIRGGGGGGGGGDCTVPLFMWRIMWSSHSKGNAPPPPPIQWNPQ
jgi:hypothetical protein